MNENNVYIYTDEVSQRLLYTLDLIFKVRDISYQVINDPYIFEKKKGLKFVYSDRPFEKEYLTISPASLLFEEDIHLQLIHKEEWGNTEILAFGKKKDVLASIFYVVTLYEEYLTKNKDRHDRIISSESLLHKYGWLKKLIVERWSVAFIDYLSRNFNVDLHPKPIPFNVIPTFDIDNTYAYLLKKGMRKFLSVSKDLLTFSNERVKERRDVLKGKQKDPYDTYDIILNYKKIGFEPILFWMLGDFDQYDRNITHLNEKHQQLIKQLGEKLEIGLHPSYKSNEVLEQLKIEKNRLASILDKKIEKTRQHFLRLSIPDTYENLIKEGFKHDYTLGFAEEVGFRAGIARPFKWFNLNKNQVEDFYIHPFAYMDGTLNEYLELTIEEAKKEIKQLVEEVKTYGGDFVCIWHNETINDYEKWKGWKHVLDYTLDLSKKN